MKWKTSERKGITVRVDYEIKENERKAIIV